jgi:DNA-binding NtrC family response regulator
MKKILIVDDEELICRGLKKAFQQPNVEIKTVNTVRDAKKEIESSSFDLCFLDIRLPDGNGLILLNYIKEISPCTKVIVLSGELLDNNIKETIGDYPFISKPFNLNHVRIIIEKFLISA